MERVLTDFVKVLRNSDVQASPAETLDAISVINTIGLKDRELLKKSLSLTLSKTPQEKREFYRCFDEFFNSELILNNPIKDLQRNKKNEVKEVSSDLGSLLIESDQADIMLSIAESAKRANISEIKYFTQRAVFTRRILENMGVSELEDEVRLMSGVGQDGQPSAIEKELRLNLSNLREKVSDYVEKQFLLYGDISGEHLREKIFKSLNMGQIDKSYMHEVHSLVRKMAKKLVNLHSRRKKDHRKGKLDIRKTLRENWSNQGILFSLNWKYKKVDRPKLLVVCDVSGSVGAYARFMLMFLFSLTEVVSKIRAFVFSSELGEITDDFKKQQIEPAIEFALSRHGGGSTDYGKALSDFVSLCLDDIDRKTTVVILGDARNNFGPDKSHLLKLVYDRAKQVYWLNPEGKYRWDTGDSIMTTYSAHCTKVMQCGTLSQLERVISTLLRTSI